MEPLSQLDRLALEEVIEVADEQQAHIQQVEYRLAYTEKALGDLAIENTRLEALVAYLEARQTMLADQLEAGPQSEAPDPDG